MRILHTNFHHGWGGQSNRILTECRGLAQQGHTVTLAVPEGSALAERAQGIGVRIFTKAQFPRGFRPTKIARDVRALRALLREGRFDIIHMHGSQDSWTMIFTLAGYRPRPVVLRTKHNMFPIRDHFLNRRLYGRWTDGIVCLSGAIVDYCETKPYLRPENIALIHSAVDPDRFSLERDRSLLEEFGIRDRFVAGVTGRLREEKGHRHLIAAMPAIVKAIPEFTLLVVGSGSLEHELRQQAAALGMREHVVFTGFRKDIARILAAIDVFVMPSLSEGLGTAILEAGAAGLPIVATRVGGIPDIVEDGETGLLVPAGEPGALAEAVIRMARDPDLAARCGAAAAEHVRAKFSEERLVERTEALYEMWLERKRARQADTGPDRSSRTTARQ
jgi:glycosyltransferase involved in cell wall biosynthesis